eukprot:TRINITY_DN20061_c0_g1_i1.p1 TRINITY_DN20061_c0_g1~~TRINITY_DN20061_c0_g1_i1.p1  ORF type:complete len:175 (+),score=27.06 TRINITY_DN20061_c0_g1_i1:79-603(+)
MVTVSFEYYREKGAAKEEVVIEVNEEWSPIGAERFLQMAADGFYDDCRFHRVVPNFIVQFGIAADPRMQAKWQHTIKDDPPQQSNKAGTISFARRGDDTRSTQVFINLVDNESLDSQGFTPFGRITKGMDSIQKVHAGYVKNKPDAARLKQEGNPYLDKEFPNLGYMGKMTVQK